LYNGATGATLPRVAIKIIDAAHTDSILLLSTKKTLNLKNSSPCSPEYGRVMMRSCKIPYTSNEPTTPTTHAIMRNPSGLSIVPKTPEDLLNMANTNHEIAGSANDTRRRVRRDARVCASCT
jgi:hypothetical protein